MGLFRPSRTFVVSVGLILLIVGLFFIPEIINLQKTISGKSTKSASTTQAKNQPADTGIKNKETRASLKPNTLTGISADLSQPERTTKTETKEAESRPSRSDSDEGLFSGWGIKLYGNRGGSRLSLGNVSLDKLNTREAQNFFKKSKTEVVKFADKSGITKPAVKDAMYNMAGVIESVVAATERKNEDLRVIKDQLINAERHVSQYILGVERDRGLFMKWQEIPVVQLIRRDSGTGVITPTFSPQMVLRTVSVQQQGGLNGLYSGMPTKLVAELAVRGGDVSQIDIYQNGVLQRENRVGKPKADGFSVIRLTGDARGLWTVIARDRFGSRPFQKNYLFVPRVRRFYQQPDGKYNIAFRPGSSAQALDRYFAVSQTRSESRDPEISSF